MNPLLTSLDIKSHERVILIKENENGDSNFVVTNLIKKILSDGDKICMVLLHNNIDHYQNIGKRLGYDFLNQIKDRCVKIIEPLKDIIDDSDSNILIAKEEIVGTLLRNIQSEIWDFIKQNPSVRVHVIIDDLSHLLDLQISLSSIVSFNNCCLNLVNENVSIIINTHVCNHSDRVIANSFSYEADVVIDVFPLKTGISREVTGLLQIQRDSKRTSFHYKSFDRGIKTFNVGESLYNLYH